MLSQYQQMSQSFDSFIGNVYTNQHNNTTATFNKRITTSNKWFLEIIDSIRSHFLVILEIDL